MATYLITGASRGIGLELTKQLLELPASQVAKIFVLIRRIPSAALQSLISKNPDRIDPITASIDNTESVRKAAEDVKAKLGGRGLDVLVNNAGTQIAPSGGMRTVLPEQMAHLFNVNVIGAQRVIVAFLPLLQLGKLKKVINISSSMGSISWAKLYSFAPFQAYKISKAALHMLNMQYSLDHADAGFTFLCISPGWLKTDLGTDHADLDVHVGVAEVKRIILESSKEQNGKFLNVNVPGVEKPWDKYEGEEIDW